MKSQIRKVIAACFILVLGAQVCVGQGPKPIKLDGRYNHDRWETRPNDIIQKFQAFIVSFDSDDDDDGDGTRDRWAIPQWVAYEVKRFPGKLGPGPDRPAWFTDAALFKKRIAPNDDSYAYPKALKSKFPYDRGHLCAKYTAFRMGADADWNTHTVLNACPQRETMNRGIWEDLERKVDAWADKYGAVWVICGPIINGRKPKKFLGQAGEVPVRTATSPSRPTSTRNIW
jgi:endonuclease G